MDCCHKWLGPVLALIIVVFAWNPTLISSIDGKWVIIIAAVLSLLNCMKCQSVCCPTTTKKK